MPSVTIDAGVLAVPSVGTSPDDAHEYVDTLLDWRKLLDETWIAICMSERTSESLFTDGLYPLRDHLRRLFAVHGIVEYGVNDVAQVVERLLQITPSFETYFRIRDVLADDVVAVPDVLQLCVGNTMRSDLARCVVLIAILRRHCRPPVADHWLILRHAPQSVVSVKAVVQLLEHERNDLDDLPQPPEVFKGNVLVCDNFRGLVECLDETAVLVGSSDDAGVKTAIRVALYKNRLSRYMEPDWDDAGNVQLGTEFSETLRRCCTDTAASFPRKALRAIVDTIEQQNLRSVHPLRTGSGGGDPQRVRKVDGAVAWRRDIDYEYHLHYWLANDGTVELASVAVHNNYTIPE